LDVLPFFLEIFQITILFLPWVKSPGYIVSLTVLLCISLRTWSLNTQQCKSLRSR
jgi:hypothetical protein